MTVHEAEHPAQDRQLGLDKSVVEQYWIWLKDLFNGDLGTSFVTSNPVFKDLGDRLPARMTLLPITWAS